MNPVLGGGGINSSVCHFHRRTDVITFSRNQESQLPPLRTASSWSLLVGGAIGTTNPCQHTLLNRISFTGNISYEDHKVWYLLAQFRYSIWESQKTANAELHLDPFTGYVLFLKQIVNRQQSVSSRLLRVPSSRKKIGPDTFVAIGTNPPISRIKCPCETLLANSNATQLREETLSCDASMVKLHDRAESLRHRILIKLDEMRYRLRIQF